MGDTKATRLTAGIKFTRLITAVVLVVFFFIVLTQVVVFTNIKISFHTGNDAQQLAAIQIKRGADVELPTPLKPGSCFLGWSLKSNGGDIIKNTKSLSRNSTLYAVWDGSEKYAVLSVNGVQIKAVNIFDTNTSGLTPSELNQNWRLNDDYYAAGELRVLSDSSAVEPLNNYSRFLGWQYLNSVGTYNDLLFDATSEKWTLVERDANRIEIKRTQISDTNKFYPPNYRTTFHALLDYRTVYVQFYDNRQSSISQLSQAVKLGESFTFPVFTQDINSNAQFSHWEVQLGDLRDEYFDADENPELASLLEGVKTRYEAGETLDALDPLLYYWASDLIPFDGVSGELVAPLKIKAVYWDNTAVYKRSFQTYTDESSGEDYINFSNITANDLSLTKPVAFESNHVWFYDTDEILAYTFYDHKGVYHEIKTKDLQGNSGFNVGGESVFMGENIYFNTQWAITIKVVYQTSQTDIQVKFNLGEGLYALPGYEYQDSPIVITRNYKIGNSFLLLNCENFMKTDYIFSGWKIVGDNSGRMYYAGENFKIQNFDTNTQSTTIEFVAVWHLQRLLFDFDLNGGYWESEPDYSAMQGAYNSTVKVLNTIPARLGYNFVGWTLQKNYVDQSELLQPGDAIVVGLKSLYAQWQPKRLRVTFYISSLKDFLKAQTVTKKENSDEFLYTNDYIKLPYVKDSPWYTLDGWKIADNVLLTDTMLQLTPEILAQLETADGKDGNEPVLDVKIYAAETRRTVNVEYEFEVEVNGEKVLINNIEHSKLNNRLTQDELFYNYYPFSAEKENGDYGIFDTYGREFKGWSYKADNGETKSIGPNTTVPVGVNKITVKGTLSGILKNVSIVYIDGDKTTKVNNCEYGEKIPLLRKDNTIKEGWGNFCGWALKPDSQTSNPDFVYDTYYHTDAELRLSHQDSTTSSPYLIDVDRYAVKKGNNQYEITLYAVYSHNYASLKYIYYDNGSTKEIKTPLYLDGNFDRAAFGGFTVDANSPMFGEYGNVVLDNSKLTTFSNTNFVGWEAEVTGNIDEETLNYFKNKLWLPGEYLPKINFNITFRPVEIDAKKEVQVVKIGDKEYNVFAIPSRDILSQNKIEIDGSIDIVALPYGDYTLKQGQLVIKSDRPVNVVVSARGNITLEPRAIQCDTIKEFYVSDNLIITGSPVVGANFEAYRVQKGYRLVAEDEKPTEVYEASSKYDFVSSMDGLLVDKDRNILYGVPSHVNMTSNELLDSLNEMKLSRIKSYAFSDMNNFATINLGLQIDDNQTFTMEDYAIFNGNMSHVILPVNGLNVSPKVLSGTLSELEKVTFGDAETTTSNYAFVENGFVYYVGNSMYQDSRSHVMYVLPSVTLNSLDYIARNLLFENSVSYIEPFALMGIDWSQVNSLTAENEELDLSNVLGSVPVNIPVFISPNNLHQDKYDHPLTQSYKKTFVFTFGDNSKPVEKVYYYGETFTVFDAQELNFQKPWALFIGWKLQELNRVLNIGESYKVGIDEFFKGDSLHFDAAAVECWENYPVQFYVFDGKEIVEYVPETFYDTNKIKYTISDLVNYRNDLGKIYLPGLDESFTMTDGSVYQFVGWGKNQTSASVLSSLLWNNVGLEQRVLPNKTTKARLNSGYAIMEDSVTIYKYYALYEKVTTGLKYEFLNDNTLSLTKLTKTNVSSLQIPFAAYYNGYMYPVSKIASDLLSSISNQVYSEIVIGGAVSEIGERAFAKVNALKITFNHRGSSIYYNFNATPVRQLTICENAFAQNDSITNVVLPAALKALDDGAFQSCKNLISVSFEAGYQLSLNSLGNFVFQNNRSMTDNSIVKLLVEDGIDGDRFVHVGDGIFTNTKINNVRDAEGNLLNRIVWKNKLLHVYYTGSNANWIFNEQEIAGYAFVNAGSETDLNLRISLVFANPDVKINAFAFSNLHSSVNEIYFKYNNSSVKISNVDTNAFDDTIIHNVKVYTNNTSSWDQVFKSNNRLPRYTFVNA